MGCWVEYVILFVIKDEFIRDDDDHANEQGATSDEFRMKGAEASCLRLCCCTFKIHDETGVH